MKANRLPHIFQIGIAMSLIWAAALGGCTLYQKATQQDIARPGAIVRVDSANQLSLFVFDARDTLISSFHRNDTLRGELINILDGVPTGRYRVVSFQNCGRYRICSMEPHRSSFNDLECRLTDIKDSSTGQPLHTMDSILYSAQFIEARWGEQPAIALNCRELFYNSVVKMVINEGYDFWEEVSSFSLEFRNLPRQFDKDGLPSNSTLLMDITDIDRTAPLGIVARLRLPRFTDASQVELHAVSNKNSLGSVLLLPSRFGVSADSPEQVSLLIDMDIQPRSIVVKINDWEVGTIQTTTVGE